MKTMHKLIFSGLMVGMISTPTDARFDDFAGPLLGTTAVVAVGAMIYACVDSNETLLRKADQYLQNVDTCQDLLNPTENPVAF